MLCSRKSAVFASRSGGTQTTKPLPGTWRNAVSSADCKEHSWPDTICHVPCFSDERERLSQGVNSTAKVLIHESTPRGNFSVWREDPCRRIASRVSATSAMVAFAYSEGAPGGGRFKCVAASRMIWLTVIEFKWRSSRNRFWGRIVASGSSVRCATSLRRVSSEFSVSLREMGSCKLRGWDRETPGGIESNAVSQGF